MYSNHSISVQIAQYRQRDLLADAERARLARQATYQAPAAAQRATGRRARKLVRQLRPQAQS